MPAQQIKAIQIPAVADVSLLDRIQTHIKATNHMVFKAFEKQRFAGEIKELEKISAHAKATSPMVNQAFEQKRFASQMADLEKSRPTVRPPTHMSASHSKNAKLSKTVPKSSRNLATHPILHV